MKRILKIKKPELSKAKAKRVFRSRRRQVGELTDSASRNIDRHVFRQLPNFAEVGRFIGAWVLLFLLLIAGLVYQSRGLRQYYMTPQAIAGGVLSEGIVGTYTTPNPLFASTTIDLSVSKLIFNSILSYDDDGNLVNDLAASISRSENGLRYTVKLRDDVYWHDGQKFSSKDVAYTYKAIQNSDTRSPYFVSWQGIKIETPDELSVIFTLPSALNPFPHSLTNGIVPAHILESQSFDELRGSDFNSRPVGTGPFKLNRVVRLDDFETIQKRQRVELDRNNGYHKGSPKIDAMVIYALSDEADLRDNLNRHTIDAAVFNSYPQFIPDSSGNYVVQSVPLLAGSYLFFNTSKQPFDNVEFRRALALGTNTTKLLGGLGYPAGEVNGPLMKYQVGYDADIVQPEYNADEARKILDSLGWVVGSTSSIRMKEGIPLSINLLTLENSDFSRVASTLQGLWRDDLGIRLDITTKKPLELQPAILQHNYDTLIYGISIGSDPDVYAYWHSSQAANDRFNLSMYKSEAVDAALEAGRTRPDIALRAAKYKPFLEAWQKDVPAIGIYQPMMFYVSTSQIHGFNPRSINTISDRFYNVHLWQIRTQDLPYKYDLDSPVPLPAE